MAKIDIVKAIANGTAFPETFEGTYASTNIINLRDDGEPLDASEIFFNELSAKAYAVGNLDPGRTGHQFGALSYVGQHISVVDEVNRKVDMYQILNTRGDLKKLLAEPLKGQTYDFNDKSVGQVLTAVIDALGGTSVNFN